MPVAIKQLSLCREAVSLEKARYFKESSAEFKIVEVKPYKDPGIINIFQEISRRIKAQEKARYLGNQFDNTANYEFHAKTNNWRNL